MFTVDEINAKMVVGNVLMRADKRDPEVLYSIASRGKTYVEIGTRWGGSAIVAGLAGCDVTCIDAFEYPTPNDYLIGTPEDVADNWLAAGLSLDKLHIYKQRHPPFPEEIASSVFDTGLIDSLHTEEQCRLDWESMKEHVTGCVLFHDIGVPGIQKVFQEGALDWEIVEPPYESQFGILCAPS